MTSDERNAIQDFVERLEAFLLTHDDDHLVAVGLWDVPHPGNLTVTGCPVQQVLGVLGTLSGADVLLPGASSISRVREAIAVFIGNYDYQTVPGLYGKAHIESLGKVRKAIETGIHRVREQFGIEKAPVESESRALVAV